MKSDDLIIVGAGIAGLTLGLVLKKRGYGFKIVESAPEIKTVGAGIAIANNAMQIYKELEIDDIIAQAGTKIASMTITDSDLKVLNKLVLNKFEDLYGVYNVAIHRASLQKILIEAVGLENIELNKKVVEVDEYSKDVVLSFDDGSQVRTKFLVGADGLKSVVRNKAFKYNDIRDTQQLCWRGILSTKAFDKYNGDAIEMWGKGTRFGFVKVNSDELYWYAVVNENIAKSYDNNLEIIFKNYHPDVLRMIHQTSYNDIILNKLFDLKPFKKWSTRRIVLIGDAAHATTPNLGQGACQGIEDAYALGVLLDLHKDFEKSFNHLYAIRNRKVNKIVKTSWQIGNIAHLENPIFIKIRNAFMRSIPTFASQKQLSCIFELDKIKGAKQMKKFLIAGLGNIGAEYANTRHNIGFKVLDFLANQEGLKFESLRYGDVTQYSFKGRTFILLKPNTYMNLSGKAIQYWLEKENIPIENLLVITDDLNLDFGTIRIKGKGSDGGHNGLKNIQQLLNTQVYARFRFGISSEFKKGQQVDYVLGEWTEEEKKLLPERLEKSVEIIKSFGLAGLANTMNSFNNK